MEDPGVTLHFRQQFSGKLEGEGPVTLYLSLFIRDLQGPPTPELYGSITQKGQDILSGFNARIQVGEEKTLQGSFQVKTSSGEATLTLSLSLHSRLKFLLGLDAKKIEVALARDNGTTTRGVLYQPAVWRWKNLLHMNIRGSEGIWRKLKDRNRLLDSLFVRADSSPSTY